MRRALGALAASASIAAVLVVTGVVSAQIGGSGVPKMSPTQQRSQPGGAAVSGVYDFNGENLGTAITECPQAGNLNDAKEIRRRQVDQVEQISSGGDDRRSNDDYSCFPQNEVSIDVNPKDRDNFIIGANDYRIGTGSSGFHSTTNRGKTFYNGIIPFPSVNPVGTTQGFLVSGGDPAVVYDQAGVGYYAQIAFNRNDDTNGITVQRSTNGGFTWSRACIVHILAPATTLPTACGGPGDPRTPGDGVVSFQHDNDTAPNGSIPFDDKEYIAAGPRPAGVQPQCYDAAHAPMACGTRPISPDRLYVTWTKFTASASQIMESHSDDQGRSWSPQKPINGSATFCAFSSLTPTGCDDNQFSVPTAHPTTGVLYVAFENFNTPDENQVLMVRSTDGGATFQGPFFVSSVFDLNFPRSGITRPDCGPRGQQFGRIVYTNSCFRSNPSGNIVVDERTGAFANDLYYVLADNRNGTIASSNSDVFIVKSVNGGSTWTTPTRVNDDRSTPPAVGPDPFFGGVGRDCLRPPGTVGPGVSQGQLPLIFQLCGGDFGADQWWPWVDIGTGGELNVAFKDRRLDVDSVAHEWPTSRQRAGNYLVWTWGAQCEVSRADSIECLAPGTTFVAQPTAPVDPGTGPQPGQGNAFLGTFKNHQVSDTPSNYDYSFRAGIFAGDYENIVVTQGQSGNDNDDDGDEAGQRSAINVFTDARNGRSSRNQPGRNPICEQSDIFFDIYQAHVANSDSTTKNYAPFLVTPCPAQDD